MKVHDVWTTRVSCPACGEVHHVEWRSVVSPVQVRDAFVFDCPREGVRVVLAHVEAWCQRVTASAEPGALVLAPWDPLA